MATLSSALLINSSPIAGLRGSLPARPAPRTRPSRVRLTSSFLGSSTTPSSRLIVSHGAGRVTCFARDWLRTDLSVIGFGLIGWLAPSSIPAINGDSLTGLFFSSIGPELAHFPTGPAVNSPFWLWLVTWHLGLFIVLTFGQIGFQGRKEGYW